MPEASSGGDLRIQYADGPGRLVVSGSLCALLPADASRRLVDSLWRLPSADLVTVARAVLDLREDIPDDFAVAVLGERSASLLLRGRATARHGAETFTASGVKTWRELELPLEGLALSLAGEAVEATLPLAGGVVSAQAVEWVPESDVAAPPPGPVPSVQADAEPGATSTPTVTPVVIEAEDPALDPVPGVVPDVEPSEDSRPLSETLRPDEMPQTGAHESVDLAHAAAEDEFDVGPSGVDTLMPEAPAATTDDDDDSYDRLFGATEHVSRRPAEVEAARPLATPLWPAPAGIPLSSVPPVDLGSPPVPAPDEAPASGAGPSAPGVISGVPLISAVPGSAAASSAPAPDVPVARADKRRYPTPPVPAPASSDGGDADDISGLTVSRSTLSSLRVGPQVHGVHCPRGHANPVEAVVCRVCGIEVPPQSATTLTRPPLGALVAVEVPPGAPTRVALEGPLLLGRRPSLDGQSGPVPTLVTVASPDNDLSRNHLRVNLDGWHVLVTDLGSTNGTVVELPGEQPERIHPQRPTMITPGTRVTLADVATYVYEVTA